MPGRGEEKLNVRALFAGRPRVAKRHGTLWELARDCGGSVDIHAECDAAIASKLPQGYSLLAVTRLALRIEIIQRAIHRQLAQHDDLRNAQQRIAMRTLQKPRKVTGHDAGRGQGFAGVGQ
ncbi:hypothetical protein D3C84_771610 [compost metagenome]